MRTLAHDGPIVEVLDAPDPEANRDMAPALYAVRELPFAAWMTIQTGCDNTCAYCIVPAVRGEEISRPFDDLRARGRRCWPTPGVTEITVLGQNVNSYGRDITERRPLFAELLRALGDDRGHREDPLHQPAPEGPAARDDRGHGRDADGLPPAAPAAAVGIEPVLAAMRRGYSAERYMERLARRRAPRSTTSP